jgi:hypothetical protein
MACDPGYAPYAFCLASRIAAQSPDRDFDIIVFSQDALVVPSGLVAEGILTERITDPNPFEGGPHLSRHGAATYLRLLIPGLMAGRYDRLLYLDTDIIANGGGIGDLLGVDLRGQTLGAVRDNMQWRTPGRHVAEFKRAGRPAHPYFNAGVLLIDVARWNAAEVLAQCVDLFTKTPHLLTRHDQTLLNLVMAGQWTELSPVWNWQYTWVSRFFADLVDPRLTHFIGPLKPWADKAATLPPRFRRVYADFLAVHYPERPAPADAGPKGWPPRLGAMLWKHWWSHKRMAAYLDRFPDPMVTLPAA